MTYLLLVLVSIIWGIIFYRLVFVSSSEPVLSVNEHILPLKQTSNSVPDSFSIFANYRDPFLNKVVYAQVGNKIKVPPTATPVIKTEKVIIQLKWPTLTYGGIIKNQKSGKQFAMVNINGQENIMKVGDTVSGIQLLKVNMESIEVSFEKEKRVVSK
ncbi:MAG TPA: hypothetical protein VFF35_05165 [Bacteroidia bacterium]|nr:hypothetical protein [Bacteroidia bacterium]